MPANEAFALSHREEWEDNFMAFVVVASDGCWNWAGAKTDFGYGMFWFAGQGYQAARLMWAIQKGVPVPSCLTRECRSPSCTNPDHMIPGRHHLKRGNHHRSKPVGGPGGQWVSAEAAAEATGVSSKTVRRWCKKGVDGWGWLKAS